MVLSNIVSTCVSESKHETALNWPDIGLLYVTMTTVELNRKLTKVLRGRAIVDGLYKLICDPFKTKPESPTLVQDIPKLIEHAKNLGA